MNETKHLKLKTMHRQFDTTHMSHDTVTLQNVCYEIYFISISPWLESKCKCNDLNAKPCNISHSDIKIQAWFLLLKNKAQFNGF